MFFVYGILSALVLLLAAPWWIGAMVCRGKYRAGFLERLGRVPGRLLLHGSRRCVWVHAVSVGEVLTVGGLVAELKRRLPEVRVVVSTTTATGQSLARSRFGDENVFFFPLDFSWAIRPYLKALRPDLIAIAETEFWPNFLRLACASGASLAIVNARISDRSLPRYRRFRGLLKTVLQPVDLFLAQSPEDARRLLEIGASEPRVQVSGNLKFDLKPPSEPAFMAGLRSAIECGAGGPVLVAGSTVEGEETEVLAGFRSLLGEHPGAVLILAPRHPERFAEVARVVESSRLRCGGGRTGTKPAPHLCPAELHFPRSLLPGASSCSTVSAS